MPRCKDCGLLAHRHRETRELREVEQLFRDERQFSPVDAGERYAGNPLCVGMVETFASNVDDQRNQFEQERSCSRFIQYQMGFSPKEHMEMNFLERQEERHRRWDEEDRKWRQEQAAKNESWLDRQARIDQEWRERQAADERQWRRKEARRERKWRKEDLKLAKANTRSNWAAGLIGFFGALATAAFAYLLSNWPS